jgi:F-box protein, helicase, 18
LQPLSGLSKSFSTFIFQNIASLPMQLTKEQHGIINSTGDIKINAVAGSGKTTTIIEYAKARPANSKILYIAFNKSVKLEAAKKFAAKGLTNVKVETAHSLAYRHIVFKHGYKVKQGYKTNEIAELLGLEGNGEKHGEYIVANHINKFIAYFCNSNKQKVQDLNYLDVVSDGKAKAFVKTFYAYIEKKTRLLLKKMDTGEIEITHDFYLKKFQLSNPQLPYDYILFDEGQDASEAMLDIFLQQKATKVIVGDTHQQIYGWRYAVNSLEKTGFTTFHLSASFRFTHDIANLAMRTLQWKEHLEEYKPINISGKGNSKEKKTKAVLARTNLGLLLKVIEYVTEKKKLEHIYFEGNINSYTYADDGASLYDVLNLYNGKRNLIRDKLIGEMKNMQELEEYIDKTEDMQLGMMVEIVNEYGNEIPGIIKSIKAKHISDDEKEKAEIIFSTVHRCKGMEYDSVQLVEDFITEEKIKKAKDDSEKENDKKPGEPRIELNKAKLNEEINLLYVAVTRTKNVLHIPEKLLPAGFPVSPQIKIIKEEDTEVKSKIQKKQLSPVLTKKLSKQTLSSKNNYPAKTIRRNSTIAYQPWTEDLDNELTILFMDNMSLTDITDKMNRTRGDIAVRIRKLKLESSF